RAGSRTAIAAEATLSGNAGDSGKDTIGRKLADDGVEGVRKVEIAGGIESEIVGGELYIGVGLGAVARDCLDRALRADLTNPHVPAVGHAQVAGRVERHARG